LGEALHHRLTHLLGLTGAGLIAGAFWLRGFNFGGAELKFIANFGLGALGLVGTLLAVLASTHLFYGEVTGSAAYCVLTRPVRRGEYIGGKFAGVAGLLALCTAALGLLLAGLLAGRGAQLGAEPFALRLFLCACGILWLKSTLVAAMTMMVCSHAGSALFASCAGFLLAIVAHLRPLADDANGPGWLRICPNLGLFDAEALLAKGQPPSATWLLGLAAYWLGYAFIFGCVAAHAFKHREL
jgi:hypothetical protein